MKLPFADIDGAQTELISKLTMSSTSFSWTPHAHSILEMSLDGHAVDTFGVNKLFFHNVVLAGEPLVYSTIRNM